ITYKDFKTFSPKMIAGLKKLPDTVASRSVPVRLKRRMRGERAGRFIRREVVPEGERLRAQIARWSKRQIKKLHEIKPFLPEQFTDRQADCMAPLLAIAEYIGHGWPERAQSALLELFGGEAAQDNSPGVLLLGDIANVFIESGIGNDKVSSGHLVEKLKEIE